MNETITNAFSNGFALGILWMVLLQVLFGRTRTTRAYRKALKAGDWKTIATLKKPWLYGDNDLARSPYMDDTRSQVETEAWREVMDHHNRLIAKIMNRVLRKKPLATVIQMPVQNAESRAA